LSKDIIHFKAGEIILLQGERSDDLFMLLEGTIEVIKNNTVISEISQQDVFFGEMSYLLNHKRTASLRAKTDVKAINVTVFNEDNSERGRVAEASLKLMRTMASRLDLANKEIARLEHFEVLRDQCYAKASSDANADLLKTFEAIDKQVNIQEQNRTYKLMKDYLTTKSVWYKLKDSVVEIISHYTNIHLEVKKVYAFDLKTLPNLKTASYIDFYGDRSGKLILNMSTSIIEKVAHSFGVDSITKEITYDTVSEMSNQILGRLKKRVKVASINLGTPHVIYDLSHLEKVLSEVPALEIEMTSSMGDVSLIYQIDINE
jgi:CRP-like cAMP-binding protein/CheY-specific phosphatase CheX